MYLGYLIGLGLDSEGGVCWSFLFLYIIIIALQKRKPALLEPPEKLLQFLNRI